MNKRHLSRKDTRLREYDYSRPGYYFITICTAVRNQNVLCSIQNVGDAALGVPRVTLTRNGEIVTQYIQNIDHTYRAKVDRFAVMPDHIHLLIHILSPEDGSPRAATPTDIPRIINTLKSLSSKSVGYRLWQRGYYDHIIRSDADLSETRQYIQNNPLKWMLDKD